MFSQIVHMLTPIYSNGSQPWLAWVASAHVVHTHFKIVPFVFILLMNARNKLGSTFFLEVSIEINL